MTRDQMNRVAAQIERSDEIIEALAERQGDAAASAAQYTMQLVVYVAMTSILARHPDPGHQALAEYASATKSLVNRTEGLLLRLLKLEFDDVGRNDFLTTTARLAETAARFTADLALNPGATP